MFSSLTQHVEVVGSVGSVGSVGAVGAEDAVDVVVSVKAGWVMPAEF